MNKLALTRPQTFEEAVSYAMGYMDALPEAEQSKVWAEVVEATGELTRKLPSRVTENEMWEIETELKKAVKRHRERSRPPRNQFDDVQRMLKTLKGEDQ